MKQSQKDKSKAKLQRCIDSVTSLQNKLKSSLSERQYESIKPSLVNVRATLNNMLKIEG